MLQIDQILHEAVHTYVPVVTSSRELPMKEIQPRASISLFNLLNMCRAFSFTLQAEVGKKRGEKGDKDQSVTRWRARQQSKDRQRCVSTHPHPTSRHAWMESVWAGGADTEDGAGVPLRPPVIPSSPQFIIQQPPSPRYRDPRGTAPPGRHNTQRHLPTPTPWGGVWQ